MAEVDARIPLGYQSPQLPTGLDLEQYKQLQYRNQLAQLQAQQGQQQVQDVNSLKQLLQSPGAIGEDGLPTGQTVTKAMAINPEMGLKFQESVQQIQAQRQQQLTNSIHQRLLGLQINEKQTGKLEEIATSAQDRYDTLLKQGVPRGEAIKIVSQERNAAIDDAQKSGWLTEDQSRTLNSQFIPEVNQAFLASSPVYRQLLKTRSDEKRLDLAGQRESRMEDTANKRLSIEQQRLDKTQETAGKTSFQREAADLYGEGTPEYKQAIQDHLKKETTSRTTGNINNRFTGRILIGGNQAAKDLENVVRLPLSSGTGMFSGIGNSERPATIAGATKAALGNKITDQESQLYQTMSTGFQRSLAAIEAAGLMPSGNLTHQMDAVIIKPGDTRLTALSKLAQTRQIVEAGMEVVAENEQATPSERAQAKKIIDKIQKAVPYTQEDISNFQQNKNGKETFQDYMKRTGIGKSGVKGGGDGQLATPKSKAEYDALPSGTRVRLPNGKEGVKP